MTADRAPTRSCRPGDPTTCLKGVGPKAAAMLAAAGIRTLGDLLAFFPRRLQEVVELDRPDDQEVGRLVRLRGRVERVARRWLPGRRCVVTVTFAAADGTPFRAAFFNRPYLKNAYRPGDVRQVEGVLERDGRQLALKNANVLSPAMPAAGPCVVRYPEIPGLSAERLRALIHQALRCVDLHDVVDQRLPAELARDYPLPADALRAMHAPATVAEHEASRQHFAVLEAVRLFRKVEGARRRRAAQRGPRIEVGAEGSAGVARSIPFALTGDQAAAVAAIRARLRGPAPMGVLLQGDVGTGKTAVAIDAALVAIAAGCQVAFLAPTEILAEQHHEVVGGWLHGEAIGVELLTGSLPAAERQAAAARVADGRAALVFGTHALLSESTVFRRLGLLIIDEQHRFGVAQRMRLLRKGASPHVLVMTATPIPRTLTLTLFGDLDVVTLRQRPPGRRPSPAVFVPRRGWPRVVRAIERRSRRGGRAYVVCPMIGEDGAKGGAVRLYAELCQRLPCRLVHGRMPAAERRAATAAFRAGEAAVLVGTTVLEVGIDVPETNLMVVVGAERFGIATLHQLRGRVGRGGSRGLCILTGEPGARVRAVCRSSDGFVLAEEDLRLRGAGELLGTRQSGSFDFRALEPLADLELLTRARQAVRREAAESKLENRSP